MYRANYLCIHWKKDNRIQGIYKKIHGTYRSELEKLLTINVPFTKLRGHLSNKSAQFSQFHPKK